MVRRVASGKWLESQDGHKKSLLLRRGSVLDGPLSTPCQVTAEWMLGLAAPAEVHRGGGSGFGCCYLLSRQPTLGYIAHPVSMPAHSLLAAQCVCIAASP